MSFLNLNKIELCPIYYLKEQVQDQNHIMKLVAQDENIAIYRSTMNSNALFYYIIPDSVKELEWKADHQTEY